MKKWQIIGMVLILSGLLAAQCGPTPTPEVIEKVVTQEVEKVVTKEVEVVVTKEVQVEVEKEVEKEVVVTPTPATLSDEEVAALWQQYDGQGIVINFLSEDTPPTGAIINHIDEFEELTGIKVNITQTSLTDVTTKVLLDFAAGAGEIQVIYADPMSILAPMYGHFTDLRKFLDDPTLPPLPNDLEDFNKMNLVGSGYMIDRDRLLAVPYDAPTMLLVYRTDIFENEKYKEMFMEEKGYDWTPGPEITWEQYQEIAAWINDKVTDGSITEVKYGTGHQARQYDSLMCDFSNVMLAYGGNYFNNPEFATWGTSTPGSAALNSPEVIQAAQLYNSILAEADPGSLSWDWNGVAEAFAAGDLAMIPEWHEYAAYFEDPTLSNVSGNVKWTLLPSGPTGSKNLWGGTGIAVNSYSSQDEQRAAWLFILWATSPEIQKELLLEGSTPTRDSVYNDPEVLQWIQERKQPLLDTLPLVLKAWQPENIGLAQGKIVTWIQVDEAIFTNLSQMLVGQKTPEQAMQDADQQINDINNWPPPEQ